ncbi:alpha/beta fold hydrolase [Brumicola blandensis]|uniref:Alpha/beta hydrolase n=1 Tax=Brumicola blandensis TaxID=3075611 RepID=A0AAW8QYH4_9ALTE|nr:alpha/beta hydrolase [Alteromonas sp. W409]MDT0581829.1 alpha/beta hydrolase [Alteromonas sp. W409]
MTRFLNTSKAMLNNIKTSKLNPSSAIWQQFAIVMVLLGVVLPAVLQAKTKVTQAEQLTTDMGTFSVVNQASELHKQAIIFIPGLMSNPSVYSGIKEQFEEQFDVHLVAIKGFAGTPQDSEFSFEQLLLDLRAYIALKKLDKPHIVGHSMGGLIGLSMAAEHEELIGKVVSIDGLPFIGPIFTRSNDTVVDHMEPQAQAMKAMFQAMQPEQLAAQTKRGIFIQAKSADDQAHIVEMAKKSDPITAGTALYEVMLKDVRKPLQTSKTRMLLLGASGAFTQDAQHQSVQDLYEQQFENVKNATVIMNTQARHFIMFDQPAWLVTQISSFLEE